MSTDVDRAIDDEIAYLTRLRSAGRLEHLAARVRLLRSHGWEVRSLAADLGVSRQWLYQTLSQHPAASPPADAPALVDLRPPRDTGLRMRPDSAEVPAPLCEPLLAMWRHVFRDKSAGTSPVSRLLDVTVHLLARRGVPYVRIAACGGVTHRTVAQRMARARRRGTLPSEVRSSFLSFAEQGTPRTSVEARDPRRMVTLVQVVAASFPRFYTLRAGAEGEPMYMFDPARPTPADIREAGLGEFTVLRDERSWARAIRRAKPDSSPLYAVPVQWLCVSSHPQVWRPQVYDPVTDFYPVDLRPDDEQVAFLTDPKTMIRAAEPIAWRGQR